MNLTIKYSIFSIIVFFGQVSFNWAAPPPEFVLLVAFEEDIEYLKSKVSFSGVPIHVGDRKYYRFNIKGKSAVVAVSKAGLQRTALTTDIALLKMKAKRVISFGVAGAVSDKCQQGDIVKVVKVVCHDRGSYLENDNFEPTKRWLEHSEDDFLRNCQRGFEEKQLARNRTIKQGALAAGNSFIANSVRRNWLSETFNVDLVDMNSAAIAESCTSLNIPFIIIRLVSDEADGNARGRFTGFIENNRNLLNEALKDLIDSIKENI